MLKTYIVYKSTGPNLFRNTCFQSIPESSSAVQPFKSLAVVGNVVATRFLKYQYTVKNLRTKRRGYRDRKFSRLPEDENKANVSRFNRSSILQVDFAVDCSADKFVFDFLLIRSINAGLHVSSGFNCCADLSPPDWRNAF